MISSSIGLLWALLAVPFGGALGFVLRWITPGRSRERFLKHDNLRVAGAALCVMVAQDVFLGLLRWSVYREPYRIGAFWELVFPPLLAYGVALGFGWKGRAGVFPPVTGIPDE